jgi:hypothetical protein
LYPLLVRPAAKELAVVVFPTPPFRLENAITVADMRLFTSNKFLNVYILTLLDYCTRKVLFCQYLFREFWEVLMLSILRRLP